MTLSSPVVMTGANMTSRATGSGRGRLARVD
jgi:hypothetical protein